LDDRGIDREPRPERHLGVRASTRPREHEAEDRFEEELGVGSSGAAAAAVVDERDRTAPLEQPNRGETGHGTRDRSPPAAKRPRGKHDGECFDNFYQRSDEAGAYRGSGSGERDHGIPSDIDRRPPRLRWIATGDNQLRGWRNGG
jgi:hypothetical protein